jgi:membrane-associated protease RseP (regulator of RpoE activity)
VSIFRRIGDQEDAVSRPDAQGDGRASPSDKVNPVEDGGQEDPVEDGGQEVASDEQVSRISIIELAAAVALVVAAAIYLHGGYLLLVVAAIVLMVMIHELGHFITAKLSGMKVTEYFFGFGPRLWSVKRGETTYGIKLLPLGGYVKIVGMTNLEEVPVEDEPRAYRSKPFHSRFAVGVAGSAMHGVMAFIMLWVLVVFIGVPGNQGAQVSSLVPVAKGVDPAQSAGIRPGDVILSAGGQKVVNFVQLAKIIESNAGHSVKLLVNQSGVDRTLSVTPAAVDVKGKEEGRIGVLLTTPLVKSGVLQGVVGAGQDFGRVVSLSVSAMAHIFSVHGIAAYFHDLASSRAAAKAARTGNRPESIYGAAITAAQAARAGIGDLLIVLISINIFVGLINLFPMLPLDGGHVVIAIYERIRSRKGRPYKADIRKLLPATYVVLSLLVVLFVTSFYLDITHPVVNPFS